MIQKLYWIASAFPSLAMTRERGMPKASLPPTPSVRNDEEGICLKQYSAFPSLAMKIKGRGACRKPARRQPHPFAITKRGERKFVLNF